MYTMTMKKLKQRKKKLSITWMYWAIFLSLYTSKLKSICKPTYKVFVHWICWVGRESINRYRFVIYISLCAAYIQSDYLVFDENEWHSMRAHFHIDKNLWLALIERTLENCTNFAAQLGCLCLLLFIGNAEVFRRLEKKEEKKKSKLPWNGRHSVRVGRKKASKWLDRK